MNKKDFNRQKYYEQGNELFMNMAGEWEDADGWEEAEGDEDDDEDYEEAEGDDWGNAFGDIDAGFSGQPAMMSARGGMRMAPVSQAYIITAANTTTTAVTNVEILDAIKRQNASTTAGISYGVGYSNITYAELLGSIAAGNPTFLCGQLRISASGGTAANQAANVLEVITIVVKDINGRQQTLSIPPELDSYQQINTQVDIYLPFYVNGLTSIKIAQILGSITITFKLFPASKASQLGTLRQRAPVRERNPQTNRALKK